MFSVSASVTPENELLTLFPIILTLQERFNLEIAEFLSMSRSLELNAAILLNNSFVGR